MHMQERIAELMHQLSTVTDADIQLEVQASIERETALKCEIERIQTESAQQMDALRAHIEQYKQQLNQVYSHALCLR